MVQIVSLEPRRLSQARMRQPTVLRASLEQMMWFTGISGIAFLIPFIFSSWLDLQHDVYYLLYFTLTLAVLGAYVTLNDIDLSGVLGRSWKLSLLVGAASTAFVVWSVLARLDATPHPNGLYFAFEIVWRGVFYGVVDALLLSAFPGLVVWQVMRRDISGLKRRAAYGGMTLFLVVIITAVYHFGYEDLRDKEGIGNPELGNAAISLPVVLSANPLGSVVAHTSMHSAAVTHAYESEDRLPPQTFVDSDD
jgi:hypothetical protein